MPYPATAVANEFLKLAKESAEPLTPMHIQKLVYFANGWYLAIKKEPLIKERIEAWEYGPVIPALYHEFKGYGSGPITSFAKEYAWSAPTFSRLTPWIEDCEDASRNEFAKELIHKIWQVYGKYTAIQLSRMTHEPGTPWTQSREKGENVIPDAQIQSFFEGLAAQNEQRAQPQA